MKKNNFKKAFTIIELMVVITIIGILASLDTGRYPTESEGLKVLWTRKDIRGYDGPYLAKPVESDAWGNPYVYKVTSDDHAYDISSYGKDGKEGGDGKNADISVWDH